MGGWLLGTAAAGFWAGVLVEGMGRRGPSLPVAALVLGVGLVALAMLARHGVAPLHRLVLVAWIAGGFLLLGGGWAGVREARIRASPVSRLIGRSVRLWGVLSTDPEVGPLGWTASARVEVVFPSAPGWPEAIRVHDSIWLEGRGDVPRLQSGDRITTEGLLEAPRSSFGSYLRHRGYAASLTAGTVDWRGPSTSAVARAANSVRTALRRSVERVFPQRQGGLLLGLALGDTSRLDPGIEEDFRATGLSHLTAVSGENLAMFLAPILGLATMMSLGRRVRFAIGLAAIGFFVMLTRAEPSVMRAAAMSGLTLLGVFLGRPRSPPAIMGGAILLLLTLDPTLVYGIGFQLSVGATAGMALLAAPVSERLRLPKGLGLAAGTTIGAQAGVTPLLLYHFGVVPVVSIPANLLAFPAVSPAMLLGLLAAALGLVVRPVGRLVAWVARAPLGYLISLSDRLARSPLPSITSSAGRLAVLFLWLSAVAGAAWWLRSGRGMSRRAVLAAGLLLPVFLWANAVRAGPPGSLTVTFFSVGQGDAALVRSPGGAVILIDGGPDPEEVATKLAALGVRRIDLMVATHPHADHVAGLPAVLARFPVGLVIDPGCRGSSPFYADFLRAVQASGDPFGHPGPGDVLHIGDVRIDVLGPEHCFFGTNSDPNNDSLVLRVTEGPASVMFPGDAEEPAQTDVLRDEPGLIPAVVLKVPHHGGATSLEQFFLAVQARVAVVSVGPNNYGHPVPAVLRELAADGMRVLRTDRAGDITVTFGSGGLLIQSTHV